MSGFDRQRKGGVMPKTIYHFHNWQVNEVRQFERCTPSMLTGSLYHFRKNSRRDVRIRTKRLPEGKLEAVRVR